MNKKRGRAQSVEPAFVETIDEVLTTRNNTRKIKLTLEYRRKMFKRMFHLSPLQRKRLFIYILKKDSLTNIEFIVNAMKKIMVLLQLVQSVEI